MNKVAISLGAIAVAAAAGIGMAVLRAPENVRYCEAIVKSWLKSPASYRRARFTEGRSYTESGNPSVRLEYDAANGYGALIRGNAECVWEDQAAPTYTGYPTLRSLYMDYKKVVEPYNLVELKAVSAAREVAFW